MGNTIIKMTDGVIRQQKNTILKGVNVEIGEGEFVYLIGKVGSGKSSFLKTLYAELPLEYGTAEVAGFQLKKLRKSQVPMLRRKCGIVFQDFKLLIDRNVYKNLEFVLQATGWRDKKAIRERIATVLDMVDMSNKQDKMPHQLSGGMRQRAMIAMALACNPKVLIADEPTTALDVTIQAQILELIVELQREFSAAVILITHDLGVVAETAHRVIVMYAGRKVEEASVGELFARPLHPYTTGLMNSIPRLDLMRGQTDRSAERLQEIPGIVPPLFDLPTGCAFAPRCSKADDKCRAERPAYEEKQPGHWAACWHTNG